MKSTGKLFAQVEKTKQRTREFLNMNMKKAAADFVDSMETAQVDTALEAVAGGDKNVFDNLALNAALKEVINDKRNAPDVNPAQVSKYMVSHNVDPVRFFNDTAFRERIIKGDDILDSNYLTNGSQASKAVCRITVIDQDGENQGFGTGFLIAPGILITNNHVLAQSSDCIESYAEFNYEKGSDNLPMVSRIFKLNPSVLFHTNADLDYTVVSVKEVATDGIHTLQDFGYLKLNPALGKIKEGNYVSIIQHPDGKLKKVALRENKVTNLSLPKFIRYVTDTKAGSSGSPVFNDKWEVVAIHHSGIPNYNDEGKVLNIHGGIWDAAQGESQIDWLENEGVRISSIVYDITTNAAINFPFLLSYFRPVTDIETIKTATGFSIVANEADVYYPGAQDQTDIAHYYSELDIDNASAQQFHLLLKTTHTAPKNYAPSKFVYPLVDVHPDGLLRSIYSGKEFSIQELMLADEKVTIERQLKLMELARHENAVNTLSFQEAIDQLENSLPYNCEHVVCQSWFKKAEPIRGDLHHLFACESGCNSFRSNHPYFDFPGYEPQPIAEIEKERVRCGNMEDRQFEPENNKGIVARAVAYFLLRYPNTIDVYTIGDMQTLQKWSNDQPVTLYEKHRNREIYLMQGNRNPFIDFPGLIDSIDFSELL